MPPPRPSRRAAAAPRGASSAPLAPAPWTPAWLLHEREGHHVLLLAGSVLLMCIIWMITFSLRIPIWDAPNVVIAQPPIMRKVFPGGVSAMVNTILALAAITAGYLGCLWAARRGFPHSFPVIIGVCCVVAIVVLPTRPVASPDVTHLAADVRTLWLRHAYPTNFSGVPSKFDDPVANQVITYKSAPSGYGPVAYAIGGIPIPFVGDGLAANVLGQKAIAATFLILAAYFAGLVALRTGQNPALMAGLVGLNPLLLFEFAGDGHNDSIMVAFGVAAMLFVFDPPWRRRTIGVGIGLLSVLSKFSLVLASPVVVAAWFPRWRKWIALAMAIIGGLALFAVVARYGPRLGTLGPATAVSLTTPANVVGHWFHGGRTYRNWVVLLSYVSFIFVAAAIVLRHRLESLQDKVAAVGLLMFLFVFACSPQMLPWYQSWYFPFAVLSGKRWLIVTSLVFTVGGFFPILALNWENDIIRQTGLGSPVDKAVLFLWLATGLTALLFWYLDSSKRRLRSESTTRQSLRATRRRAGGRA